MKGSNIAKVAAMSQDQQYEVFLASADQLYRQAPEAEALEASLVGREVLHGFSTALAAFEKDGLISETVVESIVELAAGVTKRVAAARKSVS